MKVDTTLNSQGYSRDVSLEFSTVMQQKKHEELSIVKKLHVVDCELKKLLQDWLVVAERSRNKT